MGEGIEDSDCDPDLSLEIVKKAKKRSRKKGSSWVPLDGYVYVGACEEDDGEFASERNLTVISVGGDGVLRTGSGKGQLLQSSGSTPEEGELLEEEVENLVFAKLLEEAAGLNTGEKRKKKKKKKEMEKKEVNVEFYERLGDGDAVLVEDNAKVDGGEGEEESLVMRKLLRGPRYFDPPGEQGERCYNCGNVGHFASECLEEERQKPCYVCGNFGHDGRDCPQKIDCYRCGKVGHIAKDCPTKGTRVASGRDIGVTCLLCGRGGHDAATCYHGYDLKDLEKVQCYVCKRFGHLCCLDIIDTSPSPVSCFNCGEVGHIGGGCARLRRSRDNEVQRVKERPPQLCYKCGEEGHFARGCSKGDQWSPNPWPSPWPGDQRLPDNDTQTPVALVSRPREFNSLPPTLHQRWMNMHREDRWNASPASSTPDSRWMQFRYRSHDEFASPGLEYGGRQDANNAYIGMQRHYSERGGQVKGGTLQQPQRKRSWGSTGGKF